MPKKKTVVAPVEETVEPQIEPVEEPGDVAEVQPEVVEPSEPSSEVEPEAEPEVVPEVVSSSVKGWSVHDLKGEFVRTYTLVLHGERAEALAHQFAGKINGSVKES